MYSQRRRSLLLAACCILSASICSAETIVKVNLGSTGPDIRLQNGVLSTVDDGISTAASPGDQETSVTFHGFVKGENGIVDITPPEQSSFTLSGIGVLGAPFVLNQGAFSLVTQATTGGTFELFDVNGNILLSGELADGSLHGTTGGSATGGFLTANLGTFTGPADASLDKLFSLLAPNSASLAIGLTDVISSPNGSAGLLVLNDTLQDFSADSTANIGADSISTLLPEPTSLGLMMIGLFGVLALRRR